MPELPEVETIRLGIEPHLRGLQITAVSVRNRQLRWPIPDDFEEKVIDQTIQTISRRGKYLCLHLNTLMIGIHLGMSGRLSLHTTHSPPGRHDHVDFLFNNKYTLRYTDPRRFGSIFLSKNTHHPLLDTLGVEPLSEALTADYIFNHSRTRTTPIKSFLMNHKIVVGIGNIYATEILFLAKIHPAMPAKLLTKTQATQIVDIIKQVLTEAIAKGGTTLKDFLNSTGQPGYFSQQLKVYGRAKQPCVLCKQSLIACILGQRTTVYCPHCQRMQKI